MIMTTWSSIKDRERPPERSDINPAKIILVGPSTLDKRTIANMLVQGDLLKKNRLHLDQHRDEHEVSVEVVDGRAWTVCVVEGMKHLHDTTKEAEMVRRKLFAVMKEGSHVGFHIICLVMKAELWGGELWKDNVAMFKRCFEDASGVCRVIRTFGGEPVAQSKILMDFTEVPMTNCTFRVDLAVLEETKAERYGVLETLEQELLDVPRMPVALEILRAHCEVEDESRIHSAIRCVVELTQ